eukprot:9493182-Pyramimonas_sp.AAC.1
MSKKAVRKFMHCKVHNKRCEMKPSKVHIAGLPCVDWTPNGLGKKENGPTAVLMAAWVALRLILQEPFIINENAKTFDRNILDSIFSAYYVVESMVVDAAERGLPQSRERRWTVMVHRSLVLQRASSLDNVVRLFAMPEACSWQVFLAASDDEKLHELKWAARETNPKRASSRWPTGVKVGLDVDDAFVQSLSQWELDNWK